MARKKDEAQGRRKDATAKAEGGSGSPPPSTSGVSDGGEEAAAAVATKKGRRVVLPQDDSYLVANDEHFARFKAQLSPLGLMLRDIPGDGNCLFRAIGDQLEGHGQQHFKHRMNTVRFMICNRADFEPFIDTEASSFEAHVDSLSRLGTYAGQESLVAFARFAQLNIVIHQLNSPMWQIEGGGSKGCPELHLSYHNGEHYSSVRYAGDVSVAPAAVRLGTKLLPPPGTLPKVAKAAPSAAWQHSNLDSATEGDSAVEDSGTEIPATKGDSTLPPLATTEDADGYFEADNLETLVQYVMESSGCLDGTLARSCLLEQGCNPELAIDYLINLALIASESRLSRAPSPEPLPASSKAKAAAVAPAKHLSNRERKDAKRREKELPPPPPQPAPLPVSFHCLNL